MGFFTIAGCEGLDSPHHNYVPRSLSSLLGYANCWLSFLLCDDLRPEFCVPNSLGLNIV